MKKLLFIAASVILCVSNVVSYQMGQKNSKDYQAACMLSDICHFAMDNDTTGDFRDIYYDYLDEIDCDPNAVITKEEITEYYWCY